MPSVRASRFRLVCLLALSAVVPLAARAQSGQEKMIQERLERSGTLEYVPASKSFSAESSFGKKEASSRAFSFGGRTAYGKAGDGSFDARTFNDGRGKFRADSYAVRQALAGDRRVAAQADRPYATRSADVREDREANRSLDTTRPYANSQKPYLVTGKRQDEIDELRKQKNLTIDQVREILNKNR